MAPLVEPFIETSGEHRAFWLRKPRRIGDRILLNGIEAGVEVVEGGIQSVPGPFAVLEMQRIRGRMTVVAVKKRSPGPPPGA